MTTSTATRKLPVSKRIQQTRPAVVDDVVNKYAHHVQFNLAPGAPFYGMSDATRRVAIEVLQDQKSCEALSQYGDVLGTHSLRRMWGNVLSKGYGDHDFFTEEPRELEDVYPDHELMITAGANQAFVNVILALCDGGDEVLLILPYYFSHHCALSMTGVHAVCVPVAANSFLPDLNQIEQRITNRSKAIVVVSPGNPSGVIYSDDLIDAISKLCLTKGIWLILDEAYREFRFPAWKTIPEAPSVNEHTIHLFTMSKAYGLAGWRVGAVLYPKSISEQMRKAQDTIPTHPSRFSEAVACEALRENPLAGRNGKPSFIVELYQVGKIFLRALREVYETSALDHLFVIPRGAFYFFLPYVEVRDGDVISESNDWQVIDFMAQTHSVLLTPGFIFGMPGYIRVSYGSIRLSVAPQAATALAKGLGEVLSRKHLPPPNPS